MSASHLFQCSHAIFWGTSFEQEFLGAELFDGVAEFGGFFEFEFFGGFAHVGFEVGDVGV